MAETYRLRKSIKYMGMVFAAFFLVVLCAHLPLFFLEDPARHGFPDEHAAVVWGVLAILVYGSMLLMSLYTWAAHCVERLTIEGTTISIRSMFQKGHFDASEVQTLKWISRPRGGRIRFCLPSSRLRLDLWGYAEGDRLKIIRAVHDLTPPEVQEGWALFCQKVALPLRDGAAFVFRDVPPSQLCNITRKRYDRMVVPGVCVSTAIAIALWLWLGCPEFFILPFLIVVVWLLLRSTVAPGGEKSRRLTWSGGDGKILLLTFCAIVGFFFIVKALRLLGVDKSIAEWGALVIPAAAAMYMVYFCFKVDKQRRLADESAAQQAPAYWLQREVRPENVIQNAPRAGTSETNEAGLE